MQPMRYETWTGVHACTDVTGFSPLGHSYEMCGESGLTVIIDSSRVPLLPGADSYASMGLVPAVAYQNMNHLKDKVSAAKGPSVPCTRPSFDPQTSGGLLYSVASQEAGRIMEALQKACQSRLLSDMWTGHPPIRSWLFDKIFTKRRQTSYPSLYKPGSGQPAPFHSATFSTFLNILTADQQAAKELSGPSRCRVRRSFL